MDRASERKRRQVAALHIGLAIPQSFARIPRQPAPTTSHCTSGRSSAQRPRPGSQCWRATARPPSPHFDGEGVPCSPQDQGPSEFQTSKVPMQIPCDCTIEPMAADFHAQEPQIPFGNQGKDTEAEPLRQLTLPPAMSVAAISRNSAVPLLSRHSCDQPSPNGSREPSRALRARFACPTASERRSKRKQSERRRVRLQTLASVPRRPAFPEERFGSRRARFPEPISNRPTISSFLGRWLNGNSCIWNGSALLRAGRQTAVFHPCDLPARCFPNAFGSAPHCQDC